MLLSSLLLSLLCSLATLSTGQRRYWLPLRTETGDWLTVRELAAGREFWLRPRPELQGVRRCRRCPGANAWTVTVRFWQEEGLATAQTCLRDQGFCKASEPCRVLPFQASRIVLRDTTERWEPLRPWLAVSGLVPAIQEFAIRPKGASSKPMANNSTGPEGLEFLDVEIVSAAGEAGSGLLRQPVTFTGADLRLARQLVKIPETKRGTLMSQALLSKLASRLYRMKARLSRSTAPFTSSLRAAIERQLTSAVVAFRPGMEDLLPADYRAAPDELLFVLRRLSPQERLAVTQAPEVTTEAFLRIPLATSPLRKLAAGVFVANKTAAEKVEREANSEKIRRLEEAMKKQFKIHREQFVSMIKAVNGSSSSDQGFPLLRRQVSRLAHANNISHILVPDTMNLTSIEDCFEVRTRGLKAGLFYLRPFRRTILCTSAGDLVALRRTDGAVNFNVSWKEYQKGFGDVRSGDFFLGLDFLSNYTRRTDACMKLLLAPWKLQHTERVAMYDGFHVASNEDRYRLSYAGFKGTVLFDVLSVMNGQMFTTFDRDNDRYVGNCATVFAAGNWYNSCQKSNIFAPYKTSGKSGMCSQGIDASQGDMCSPLTSVHMLLKRKEYTHGSKKVVFSKISTKACSAELVLFTVPASGIHTLTVGGAPGGRSPEKKPAPGGRGAKVRVQIFLRKGTVIGVSAGCPGASTGEAGNGGDASWVVDRSKGILLAAAGGGGGAGDSEDNSNELVPTLPGLHGQASTEGTDGWRNSYYSFEGHSGTVQTILRQFPSKYRGKGWFDLRKRLLFQSSGSLRSGAEGEIGNGGGGGGGGYEGGFADSLGASDCSGGGGGGSFCNATESISCDMKEGGNGQPIGFVVIERNSCF